MSADCLMDRRSSEICRIHKMYFGSLYKKEKKRESKVETLIGHFSISIGSK